MRRLILEEGGRPLANDDFEAIQTDLNYATTALFQELPPHIVANVLLLDRGGSYDLTFGIVWLGNELLKFDGASGISLPAEIVLDVVATYDSRAYQTGGTKPCIVEQRTLVRPATDELVPKITITANGGLRHHKVLESRFRCLGEVQQLTRYNVDHYDGTGKGKPGTEAHGWGLCNAQDGRADMRQRFLVGMDRNATDYAAPGKLGGEAEVQLTVAQLPSHQFNVIIPFAADRDQGDNGTRRVTLNMSNKTIISSNTIGADESHNNVPPYFVVVAREWIGF